MRSGENDNDEIIIDTVTEMSGMEALIVFGVGLDYVRSDNEHKKKSMRCCIYKAITRAHLTFYVINEEVQGGWFEWIGFARKLETQEEEFNFEDEKKNVQAVILWKRLRQMERV